MPIVLAHGQPKSGSTFLYIAALEMAALANGEEYYRFRNARLGDDFVDFQPSVTPALVDYVADRIRPNEYIVLKTHNVLTPDLEGMIDSGAVLALTSFRDPRDTVLSTLDAGRSDRERGSTRWFSRFTEVEQLILPVKRQFTRVVPWIRHPKVLAIPYYLTAMRQSTAVAVLAQHLGCGHTSRQVAQSMEARKLTLPEWNKGLADRYIDGLSGSDVRSLNEAFADILPEYDQLLRQTLSAIGHRLFCEWAIAQRDRRLEAKLTGDESDMGGRGVGLGSGSAGVGS